MSQLFSKENVSCNYIWKRLVFLFGPVADMLRSAQRPGRSNKWVLKTQIRPLAAKTGGGRELLARPTLLVTVIGGSLLLSPSDTGQLCGNLEQRNNALQCASSFSLARNL
jgi:hypothetical protein